MIIQATDQTIAVILEPVEAREMLTALDINRRLGADETLDPLREALQKFLGDDD